MTLFDGFLKRETGGDLPSQTSDEELLAWAEQLRTSDEPRPRRTRPLVAAPLE